MTTLNRLLSPLSWNPHHLDGDLFLYRRECARADAFGATWRVSPSNRLFNESPMPSLPLGLEQVELEFN